MPPILRRMTWSPPVPHGPFRDRRRHVPVPVVTGLALAVAAIIAATTLATPQRVAAARDTLTVLGGSATSLDPAVQSDAGSAEFVLQLFESLTAVDSKQHVQPALAASWKTSSDGKEITFTLRDGLKYSDGSKLVAADVVKSWMRVINPAHPSQLASLMDDVVGAKAYRQGKGQASAVGLTAPTDTQVKVTLNAAASDFPAILSSPTFAIVPPTIDSSPAVLRAGTFVGSGAYVLSALSATETTLKANTNYWAGTPAIKTVHILSDLPSNTTTLDAFSAGSIDYAPISSADATKVIYDPKLGPQLRIEPSPSTEYFGFNTTRPPLDNVHVRRAFAHGINWTRIVALFENPLVVPATGMVPVGVPGHSTTSFAPKFDLALAKSELAAAGYANGSGFPKVTLITPGTGFDADIIAQLHDTLGITIDYIPVDGDSYNKMLLTNPPQMWWMDWVADYPGADDFLGLLLGTGKENNWGRWSSPAFDSAIDAALSTTDPAAVVAAFDRAQTIVRDDVPVIPVAYSSGYALSAPGLLGAQPNPMGIIRFAGLAWAK